MAIPSGSHYVPGTNRHSVRLDDGRTVTRSTAEGLAARERGFRSEYERKQGYRAVKESRSYEETKQAAREHGTSAREFNDAAARLHLEYKHAGNKYSEIDKSPNGALAKYLVAIGRRSETADYRVGDSPKV